jgi:hypothetical protein
VPVTVNLSITLKKLDLVSNANRPLLQEFSEYVQSKDRKSDRNIISQLELLIFLDRFVGPDSFTSINNKEQILSFLNHRWDGQAKGWIERKHDSEGKWITSYNFHLGLFRTFFKWLYNRHKSEGEEWEI